MKILVVEDEAASLKLAHLVLAEEGHEITEAEAAGKAVEEILRSEPDAILLDLGLPGINGLTLARNLKRDPKTQHIAIIMTTGFPERYSRKQAIAAGCDGYIVKPMNTRTLSKQSRTRSKTEVGNVRYECVLIVINIATNRKLVTGKISGSMKSKHGGRPMGCIWTEAAVDIFLHNRRVREEASPTLHCNKY
jgi:two-component system cell cycle response regulator DivK